MKKPQKQKAKERNTLEEIALMSANDTYDKCMAWFDYKLRKIRPGSASYIRSEILKIRKEIQNG